MKESFNSDKLQEDKNKIMRNNVWLWCTYEGYEKSSQKSQANATYIKNGETTSFIFEFDKSKDELLECISKTANESDYIYIVIDDNAKRRELVKVIPDYCGIFCHSNAFGFGGIIQIFKEPQIISKAKRNHRKVGLRNGKFKL